MLYGGEFSFETNELECGGSQTEYVDVCGRMLDRTTCLADMRVGRYAKKFFYAQMRWRAGDMNECE